MPEYPWTTPQYSRADVNRAGQTLLTHRPGSWDYQQALTIVNNWRLAHRFPLNTFQINLRRSAGRSAIVVSRIKRRLMIENKLSIMPHMKVTQMQDIGGCRAIVNSVDHIRSLVQAYSNSRIKHELIKADNYIDEPRVSGYRGFHLVYKYRSGQRREFDGLKIEIQCRTKIQHTWAAAVEMVGLFKGQQLKSGLGDPEWLRFFALMGSFMARLERRALVVDTPDTREELLYELRFYIDKLKVIQQLERWHQNWHYIVEAVNARPSGRRSNFLLDFNREKGRLLILPFTKQEETEASEHLLKRERRSQNTFLASARSLTQLQDAYPSYFAGTKHFINLVRMAKSGWLPRHPYPRG